MNVEYINFLLGLLVNSLIGCNSLDDCKKIKALIFHFITELNIAYRKGEKDE